MNTNWLLLTIAFVLTGCHDSSFSTSQSSRTQAQEPAAESQDDADTFVDEMVTPPNNIAGTYLQTRIVEEKSGTNPALKIGVAIFQDGDRVIQLPDIYSVQKQLTVPNDPSLIASLGPTTDSNFDFLVQVSGSPLAELKSKLSTLSLSISIVNKKTAQTFVETSAIDAAIDRTNDLEGASSPNAVSGSSSSGTTVIGGNGTNGVAGTNGTPGF